MIKTFPFRLDIEKEYNNRMYSVNSNDLKTVKFTFVITDNGIPLDLTGLTIRIAIRKPDKKAVWQDCNVTNAPKGEVEVILESQAYIKKGEHEAELMLYKGNDTVAITQKFHYRAAEGIMSDKSLKSETVLGPIDEKLAEVEGTLEDLRKNGTGIDAQARADIEKNTAALADTAKKSDLNSISPSQIDKNKGKFDQTYLSDELKQQIAGNTPINAVPASKSLTTDKFVEGAVKVSTTSFAKLGKNKFEGEYIHKLVLAGAPSIGATVNSDANGGYIAITRVEPGKTYAVSKSQDTDRFRIASCPNYPKVGENYPNYWHDNETIKDKRTFTVGASDIYLIVYVSSPTENKQPEWLQIEEGSTATPYSPPKAVLDLEKRSIGADVVKGYRQNGYISGDPASFRINMDTQKITTNATAHVTVGNISYATGAGEWSFADLPTNSGVVLYDPVNKAFRVIRMAEDINNTAYDHLVFIGVIRRDKKAVHLNGLYTDDTVRQTTPTQLVPKFIFSGDDNSEYVATNNYIDMTQQNDVAFLYQQYDSLMSAYPNYITKTELGATKNGNALYRYDFKMSNVQYDGYTKPKILLMSGIHGHEKFSVYGALAFFRDLCQRWTEQKSLRFLRGNVHFVFIPLFNPDGYALNQRKNGNGVDLARNFPTPNYVAGADPNSENYAGPSANSENETKILTNLLSNEKDVFFTIDFHNYSTFSAFKDVLWIGTKEEKARKISLGFAQSYDMKVRQEFPTLNNSDLATTSVRALVSEASVTDYLEFKGQKGVIVEAIVGLGTTNADTQRLNADLLGNYILSVVRGYGNLQ